MFKQILTGLSCMLFFAVNAGAETVKWTLTNHAGDYTNELVRLGALPKTPFDGTALVVKENGVEVPYQVEVLEGTLNKVAKGEIWVMTTIASKQSHVYEVQTNGTPKQFAPKVFVGSAKNGMTLSHDSVSVQMGSESPIASVQFNDIDDLKGGNLKTTAPFKEGGFSILCDGKLFARVRCRASYGEDKQFYHQITVTLLPDKPYVFIEEEFDMPAGTGWLLWPQRRPETALMQGWYSAPDKKTGPNPDESLRSFPLDRPAHPRTDDWLIELQPRWTQDADAGWLAGWQSGDQFIGAMPMRAGRWVLAKQNRVRLLLDADAGVALHGPSQRGARAWMLFAGPRAIASEAGKIVQRETMTNLDKITHDYLLDWPGRPDGGFRGEFFFTGATNPTGSIRQQSRALMADIKAGKLPAGDRGTLSAFQVRLDPDWWGQYYNFWSPINPNFNTDFIKYAILQCTGLKGHPRFKELSKLAEEALRRDVEFGVTLPGGAGQECPGYTAHALSTWLELAPLCREHLGFDPMQWPRIKEAVAFLVKTSQPMGDGRRRILPMGDTHPPGPDVMALAQRVGLTIDIASLKSEEFPGFGAVLRSHSGKNNENFLAFKAGPNRGHFHGDQLSFHYIGDGRRLAIDHMCSYAPRADQEHMHNRVSFAPEGWEDANMDGHERLIAFKTGDKIDVAMGQVESTRLRCMPKTPQEILWQPKYERKTLEAPLVYRRTLALVKHGAGEPEKDYVVIRDQHWGADLKATYALHVESDKAERNKATINFGKMTLFVAHPAQFDFERFDWSYTKGRTGGKEGFGESTAGARLTVRGPESQFITVLYPSGQPPKMEAIESGVRLTFAGGKVDEITFGDDVTLKRNGQATIALTQNDIDLNRSQGEIGLFIPEAGYYFGEVPQWLIDQRAKFTPMTPRN